MRRRHDSQVKQVEPSASLVLPQHAVSVVVVPDTLLAESPWRQQLERATPPGLKTFLTFPESDLHLPTVLLVHGSLDRGASFSRSLMRLDGHAVITYDRRGYQGSRGMDLAGGFSAHLDDLLAMAGAANRGAGVIAVGHSFGGVLVQAAALHSPELFLAIGAFEPPMPWLGFHRQGGWPPLATDPGDEAERFFRRMMGDHAWERMAEGVQQDRRADGPALLTDLSAIRTLKFDATQLSIPVVYGTGVEKTAPHHLAAVEWLGTNVPLASVDKITEAGHGAHLSHPDAFARFIALVVAEGSRGASS